MLRWNGLFSIWQWSLRIIITKTIRDTQESVGGGRWSLFGLPPPPCCRSFGVSNVVFSATIHFCGLVAEFFVVVGGVAEMSHLCIVNVSEVIDFIVIH